MKLRFAETLLAAQPHLPAFWPDRDIAGPGETGLEVLPEGAPAPPGAAVMRFTSGPFRPVQLGPRAPLVGLLAAEAADPLALALVTALAAPPPELRQILERLCAGRIGAPSGLDDPGLPALGVAARSAVLVLDPCDAVQAEAAASRLGAARGSGLPVLVAQDPFSTGAPVLPGSLPRLDPWTLLEGAAQLSGASRDLALLALAAGVALRDGPLAGQAGDSVWAALLAAMRWADPVRARPSEPPAAIETLALWKRREAESRGIAACLGVHPYKQPRLRELLASSNPPPGFHAKPGPALDAATARGGALLAWSASAPPTLPAQAASRGVELLWLEDGFLRSAGLGAAFRAGASFALDRRGPYYDPAAGSDLEHLLATVNTSETLRARARALRAAVVARGFTKYNLRGVAPVIAAPPGRKRLLVPGQVEDDASVQRGGGAIRSNLALLEAVRAAEPEAFLIYKPHPDIEAGFRRGRIPAARLAGLADLVLREAPMASLFGQVDAVHTLTSLTGFEALLRGLPVTVWGRPFYAGWGLTEDRAPPLGPRRVLSLDELVAVALILYPRCVDPLTGLPCEPELLLERLDRPELFPVGERGLIRAVQGFVTRAVSRLRRVR